MLKEIASSKAIDVLIKVNENKTILVLNNGEILSINRNVENVIDEYLETILLTYESSMRCFSSSNSKQSKYKKPLVYISNEGANFLIPVNSVRNKRCFWISLEYCLNKTKEDFCELTGCQLSFAQWSRILQIGLYCKNLYSGSLELPHDAKIITNDQLIKLLNDA